MSTDAVQSFRKMVGESPQLQARISASYAVGDVAAMIKLGAERGLDFTEQELFAVFGQYLTDELTESELESIVGGAGVAGSLSGFERSVISTLPASVLNDCRVAAPIGVPTAKF